MDDQSQKKFVAEWCRIQNQGMVHYVLRHGLLPIGIAVIVGGNVSRWLHNQPTLFSGVLSDQEIANLLWIAVAGIAFGFVKWNLNQRKYRNIVSKGVS